MNDWVSVEYRDERGDRFYIGGSREYTYKSIMNRAAELQSCTIQLVIVNASVVYSCLGHRPLSTYELLQFLA